MRKLIDSDIFSEELNRNNRVLGQVSMILSNADSSVVFLNEILHNEIKRKIVDKKKTKIATDILAAIENGQLLLIYTPPARKLSDIIPFVSFKQNGVTRILVNFSSIALPNKLNDGSIDYEIRDNVNKAYVLLHSAYLTLDKFQERSVMAPEVVYNASILWAEMFTKPLFDVIGLNNIDRKYAFMYLAMKFFAVYFLGCSEDQAEKNAMRYIHEKNQVLVNILDNISARDINIYKGVKTFLETLLNNEITNIKGIKINNVSNTMDISFYLSKFSTTFGSNALLSLCAFPYFMYALTAATGNCNMMKDKSFDRILTQHKKILNRLLIDILK